MAARVLIATSSFGEYDGSALKLLADKGFEVKKNPLGRAPKPEELPGLLEGCAGVIAGLERYDDALLAKCPALKAVSRCGAGVDNVDQAACRARGIQVLSTPDGPTQAVAELALAMILNLIRHVSAVDREIRQDKWNKPMGFLLSELTVGVLGLGRIGRRLSAALKALGAKVIGCDKAADPAWAKAQGVALKTFDEILAESDVLSLHLPLDKDLHHLIGAPQLARMKPGAFLLNTSRGGLVDEDALAAALKAGRLGGAAVDAFEREPYKGPLRDEPRALLTSHIGSYARAGRVAMEKEAVENLIRVLGRMP